MESDSKPLVAVVLGATGAVGNEIVGHLLDSSKWGKVITIGRRPLDAALASRGAGKLEQLQINMDNMKTEAAQAFQGADTVFCALGTTRKVAGSADQFRKVDLDWVAESARLAKAGGCAHFSLLTAAGAKADAWSCDLSPFHGLLYMKTKGMAEEAAKAQGFAHLSIFRPGMLDRGALARPIEKFFAPFFGDIKVSDLGRLMVLDAEACASGARGPATSVFEMKGLQAAAKAGTAP